MYCSTRGGGAETGRNNGYCYLKSIMILDFFLQIFVVLDVTTLHCHAPGNWGLA